MPMSLRDVLAAWDGSRADLSAGCDCAACTILNPGLIPRHVLAEALSQNLQLMRWRGPAPAHESVRLARHNALEIDLYFAE